VVDAAKRPVSGATVTVLPSKLSAETASDGTCRIPGVPLTYFPILVVANDPTYVGEKTNSKALNAVAFVYLVILLVVAVATIPLMIITRGGA
jgi:hypothetical protein